MALQGSEPFCIGMEELCGCNDENEPPTTLEPPKKKLKLQRQQPRFKPMSDDNMTTICKGYVSPNTAKNTVEHYCVSRVDVCSPKSVYQLLCGILHYMRSKDPTCLNFLARDDPWLL